MRTQMLGQIVFGLSIAALGALTLGVPGFAALWAALPKWLAWHDTLVTVSAAILLASGLALLVPRLARPSALILAVFFALRMGLQIPRLVGHPLVEINWFAVSENLILAGGAWTIYSLLAAGARPGNVRLGQILFALSLPAIGLSHFFYMNMTAPLIPAWLPFHVALGYLTGAAHIAAGAGILFGVLPRLAATLEAAMVSLFTLLVWVPLIAAVPANHGNWPEICLSAAISGAAWAVAESYWARA